MLDVRKLTRNLIALQILLITLVVLIVGTVSYGLYTYTRLPTKLWLPDSSKYGSDDDVLFNLPVTTKTLDTKYGKAITYSTSTNWSTAQPDVKAWTTIYEFKPSKKLNAAECPNISKIEELSPGGCVKIGTIQNSPVYAMNRRLPSGISEYFVQINKTFIFLTQRDDGGKSLSYLKNFKQHSRLNTEEYLTANKKQVAKHLAEQKAAFEAAEKASSIAYTYLDFLPAIPQTVPTGWQEPLATQIRLDGPDAKHPQLVRMEYGSTNKQYITVTITKLSDAKLGITCTSKYNSIKDMPCSKAPGTNYYAAYTTDADGTFSRYIFYPVDGSLVVSQSVAFLEQAQQTNWLKDLTAAQDAITLSAKTSDSAVLKGSRFFEVR